MSLPYKREFVLLEVCMVRIGVDLGGTNIAAGIVDENGKIIKSGSTPTLEMCIRDRY